MLRPVGLQTINFMVRVSVKTIRLGFMLRYRLRFKVNTIRVRLRVRTSTVRL